MTIDSKKKWFWAWLVQMTVPKSQRRDAEANVEVWKNLVILQAADAGRALAKAYTMGLSAQGDCRGSLRLNGQPATVKFIGIADMGLIHDGLEDGTEILWQLKKCRQRNARQLVKSKSQIVAILKKELTPTVAG